MRPVCRFDPMRVDRLLNASTNSPTLYGLRSTCIGRLARWVVYPKGASACVRRTSRAALTPSMTSICCAVGMHIPLHPACKFTLVAAPELRPCIKPQCTCLTCPYFRQQLATHCGSFAQVGRHESPFHGGRPLQDRFSGRTEGLVGGRSPFLAAAPWQAFRQRRCHVQGRYRNQDPPAVPW
jgi:hypothetical protein